MMLDSYHNSFVFEYYMFSRILSIFNIFIIFILHFLVNLYFVSFDFNFEFIRLELFF